FFQAEDGIRDFHVTGVQTCALPIFVYQNDILVAEKNYVYGNEGMVEPFALNSNIEYTFIAVSKNSASTLPVISDKNNLTTAQIKIGRASCREREYTSEVGVQFIEEQ